MPLLCSDRTMSKSGISITTNSSEPHRNSDPNSLMLRSGCGSNTLRMQSISFIDRDQSGNMLLTLLFKAKLVVEVDGDTLCGSSYEEEDKIRTTYLESLGLKVLRFTNDDIIENLDGVVETIERWIESKELLNPLPEKHG